MCKRLVDLLLCHTALSIKNNIVCILCLYITQFPSCWCLMDKFFISILSMKKIFVWWEQARDSRERQMELCMISPQKLVEKSLAFVFIMRIFVGDNLILGNWRPDILNNNIIAIVTMTRAKSMEIKLRDRASNILTIDKIISGQLIHNNGNNNFVINLNLKSTK